MRNRTKIELKKAAVFLVTADGKRMIAAPISFHSIGERLDGTRVVEIQFVDCDEKQVSELFNMSAVSPRNLHRIADGLGDKGYAWPSDGPSSTEILKAVVAKMPKRRFQLVGAPGWYDDAIVTPLRRYGGTKRIIIDPNTGAHLAAYTKGPGSLKAWKKTVGTVARRSTRLRLSIGAAFAAPLLRPLSMDSFAINLFGPSSEGKSSIVHGAASVPGLNDDEKGLPKWSDSNTGIEQLAIGHRDGLLPLDESGDADNNVPIHEKAKRLAFLFSRNRARTVDKSHQKKTNLTVRDFRVIVLSTSEFALKDIAERAGTPRIGGEEVRFIDVPAIEPNGVGVFDCVNVPEGHDPRGFGRALADQLRQDAKINQGFAMDAFLKRFMKDPGTALTRVRQHMARFTAIDIPASATGADHRIRANFAVMYAAAALAIDYKILPWREKNTLAAIAKCMEAAFATVRGTGAPALPSDNSDSLLIRLNKTIQELSVISIKKGSRCGDDEAQRREAADGFRVGEELWVKSKRLDGLSPPDLKELVARKILRTEKRADGVPTVSKKIAGLEKKFRCYIIDPVLLAQSLESGLPKPNESLNGTRPAA